MNVGNLKRKQFSLKRNFLLFDKYSNFIRLQRVVVYGPLRSHELQQSLTALSKMSQFDTFSTEFIFISR